MVLPGSPDRARDSAHMRRALALARKGWGRTAPNPMVGAVVVRDGTVVGEGYHAEFGEPHAEPVALGRVGELARGATLYVSLEPCAHVGKTPPCVEAIVAAGIARVVFATRDPSAKARGGMERLRAAGIDVDFGVEEEEARELNAAFFHAAGGSDRPFIRLKLALSLDGAISDYTRRLGWLTGPPARREVHLLRAESDAVAVGSETALCDNPSLTVRGVAEPRVPPVRIVFDRRLRLPADSELVRSARGIPVIVVTSDPPPSASRTLEEQGVEIVPAASLEAALRTLREREMRSILVEGGAGLASALLSGNLVDRLIIFRAPVVLGQNSLNAFSEVPQVMIGEAVRWRVVESRLLENDVMTVYAPSR
jgi:diaminohydroxyphosphoribosylaminopyrimidine deaminase / 5-amino-6-(5-phosphoribosylamino)uracil reductase